MSVDIIQGDCVEVMRSYSGQVDLIVTSLPYDSLRDYGGHASEFDFEATVDACIDVLKPGGVICWNVQDQQKDGNYSLTSLRQAIHFQDRGLNCWDKLIYRRKHPKVSNSRAYLRSYEYVFIFSKGDPKSINLIQDRVNIGIGDVHSRQNAGRSGDASPKMNPGSVTVIEKGRRTDVWDYSAGYNHTAPDMPEAHDVHPAMMPLALAKDLIRSYSDEGDLVLDPLVGSGTTAVAAKYLLRDCVGIDINAEYCEFARLRTSQEVLV